MGHIQIWHHIFFYQKILKYFNDFQNRNFSVLPLKYTQTMEMKQNQTFFHGSYSNLTLFFVGHKLLKYFNDFYNWHLSISLQRWTQTGNVKMKLYGVCANLTVFFLIYNEVYYLNDFWNLFLDKVYLKNEWQQSRRKNRLRLSSFRKC